MSVDNQTVIVGNLVEDPVLRYSPNGMPVANLRLAVNERIRTNKGWEDGDTQFFSVVAWRRLAEHAAESLRKGDRAIVAGRWRSRTYQSADGAKHTQVELHADDLGPSLKFAITPQIQRTRERTNAGITADQPDQGRGLSAVPF